MSKMKITECRSCGAECFWAITSKGNPMLVDKDPNPAGGFKITGTASTPRGSSPQVWFDKPDDRDSDATYYESHWATCPNGNQHRSR